MPPWSVSTARSWSLFHCAGDASPATAGASRCRNDQHGPGPMTAVQKAIEETCPSPIARRLTATRSWPASSPLWSGCATALGLHRAAASVAYSAVKQAPSTSVRAGLSGAWSPA